MKLLHVVGARPNFVKLAPTWAAGVRAGLAQVLVHTGQHYDENMSAVFFRQFGLPRPDHELHVGSGTQASQTAEAMLRLEPVLQAEAPDWVVVYGDVNSTLAAALVAAKLGQRVAHVEAGLRSRDWTMPEEINRVVTDRLADLLLTPSPDADAYLRAEGVDERRIVRVGNIMVDALLGALPAALALDPVVPATDYILVTLHRPSNVDDRARLAELMAVLTQLAQRLPVVFPVHPRTRKHLEQQDLLADLPPALHVLEPLGYLPFLRLQHDARVVVTDSGGIQEETTALGVPCLTLRPNTERPITIEQGTNTLVPGPAADLLPWVDRILRGAYKTATRPDLWDGHTAHRIVQTLTTWTPVSR